MKIKITNIVTVNTWSPIENRLINYQNVEMNNCFEWERLQQLKSGNYLINLIIEGRVAAQQQFKLK